MTAAPAILALAVVTAAAAQGADTVEGSTLTVRGEAELRKPADRLVMSIGVVTQHERATEALAANTKAMNAVIAALEKAEITEDEYETGRFSIQPQHDRRPRGANPEWQPTIIGYDVTNTLTVRTERIDAAGRLIEAANAAGANSISVGFDLAEPRVYRAEAITVAVHQAKIDAEILAKAAGVRLVRIRSLHLDEAGRRPTVMYGAERMMAAGVAAEPPVTPGDVPVRASVTMVYDIGE